jgi:type II secretory pathway pseudopilin PulG
MIAHAPTTLSRQGGFSLTGLSLALAAVSIGAAVTIPRMQQRHFRERAASTQADLTSFAAAFRAQANAQGEWPAGDGAAGAVPAGMSDALEPKRWQTRTPLGGRYAWDTNSPQRGRRYRAAIVIVPVGDDRATTDARPLRELDRLIDDGNLASGNLVLGFQNQPVFVLEP